MGRWIKAIKAPGRKARGSFYFSNALLRTSWGQMAESFTAMSSQVRDWLALRYRCDHTAVAGERFIFVRHAQAVAAGVLVRVDLGTAAPALDRATAVLTRRG